MYYIELICAKGSSFLSIESQAKPLEIEPQNLTFPNFSSAKFYLL
jgi:hypothetical protein